MRVMAIRAREPEFALLRVICCAMVVALHTGSIYLAGWTQGQPEINRTVSGLMQSVTRDAVPLFVMLSGAFLLGKKANGDFKRFYCRSFRKLGIPTIVFSFLYVCYSYALLLGKIYIKRTQDSGQMLEPLRNWLHGAPYFHMWFMYMLSGLYLLTPVLVRLKECLTEFLWFVTGVICLVGGVWLLRGTEPPWWLQWSRYLGYFILGNSIREYFLKRDNRFRVCYLCIGTAALLVAVGLFEQKLRFGILPDVLLIHPLSPLIAVSSIGCFAGFAGMKIPWDLSRHGELTFYIYLLHGGVLSILDILIRNVLHWDISIVQMLWTAVLTYGLSWLAAAVIKRGIGIG